MNECKTEFSLFPLKSKSLLVSFITFFAFLRIVYAFDYSTLIKDSSSNLMVPSPKTQPQSSGTFAKDKTMVVNK